ncbi:MAG: STAS domain-containing protein [Oscillospiraceae bacterium]|nr:STAS domain-containing protein [Oscillospiraceae bacterium]
MIDKENPKLFFENGVLRAKVIGDIDHHCAKYVRERIDSFIYEKKPRLVLLDLSCVDFMDSSGLGLILGRFNTTTEMGAEFRIYKPSGNVQKILELAGIERLMKIEGDLKNEACR